MGKIFVLLFFMSLGHEALAGVVIEQVVRDLEGRPSKGVLYISGEKLRTDSEGSGLTTIVDFGWDRFVMIDHRSRRYVEIRLSEWEKEVARRLKEDLPGVRPSPRKITVKKTGQRARINGFLAEKIQVFAESELIEEDWMTLEVDRTQMERVLDHVARGFSREFRGEMKEGREIYEKLRPYGFPIRVRDFSPPHGQEGIEVLEVKKIEYRELEEEVFLPPSGYEQVVPEPSGNR